MQGKEQQYERKCVICEESFETPNEYTKCCSLNCVILYFQNSNKGNLRYCLGCRNSFLSSFTKKKFCSTKCKLIFKKKLKVEACKVCGDEITSNRRTIYCSNKCYLQRNNIINKGENK